jgi:DNA-binding MarR family transcriptional regulator
VEIEAHRDLAVLEAIAEDQAITQRRLARLLGVALGLTNRCVQRLIRTGCIECVPVRPNRLQYLLTPKGVEEKARLTYEFMAYSLRVYAKARRHVRDVLSTASLSSGARIAVYGTGEAAELTLLSLKEVDAQPAAILSDDDGVSGPFLGLPVFNVGSHPLDDYDVVVVAAFEDREAMIERLARRGVPADRIVVFGAALPGAAVPGAADGLLVEPS